MTDKYAVVGNPISHSKSPQIHTVFAKETQQDLIYQTLESPLDEFSEVVGRFFDSAEGKGLNVTVPFKEQAWDLCSVRSERAELAGAVNTLYQNEKGELCGDNTDGYGLVSDLLRHGAEMAGKRILMIGAGGAVRGVLQPILEEKPAELVICNRTLEKAQTLAELFKGHGTLKSEGFSDVAGEFDIVINGTSASLSGELPPISSEVFGEQTVAYDMMYSKEETVFNQWAKQSGAKLTIDGLGMLVGQAAEAFAVWRGVRPEVETVLQDLRGK